MRPLTCLLAALILLAATAARAQEDEPIGYVKTVSGEASIERDGGRAAAVPGAPVYRNDRLTTGDDGTRCAEWSMGPGWHRVHVLGVAHHGSAWPITEERANELRRSFPAAATLFECHQPS